MVDNLEKKLNKNIKELDDLEIPVFTPNIDELLSTYNYLCDSKKVIGSDDTCFVDFGFQININYGKKI